MGHFERSNDFWCKDIGSSELSFREADVQMVLKVVLWPPAAAAPGTLLEMQILRLHPSTTESEVPGAVTAVCMLRSSPLRDFDVR